MISGVMQIETSLVMHVPALRESILLKSPTVEEGEKLCDLERLRRGSELDCIVNFMVWKALERPVKDEEMGSKEISEDLDVSKISLPPASLMQFGSHSGANGKGMTEAEDPGHVRMVTPEALSEKAMAPLASLQFGNLSAQRQPSQPSTTTKSNKIQPNPHPSQS